MAHLIRSNFSPEGFVIKKLRRNCGRVKWGLYRLPPFWGGRQADSRASQSRPNVSFAVLLRQPSGTIASHLFNRASPSNAGQLIYRHLGIFQKTPPAAKPYQRGSNCPTPHPCAFYPRYDRFASLQLPIWKTILTKG